ncbi:fasciclin domain-containing protein [Methanoculleus sp. 7T]|uniref:fasciclin domain-containing protein n=1 Tax=Methanoculleus sp. 7T TaxID=2937282 RepID=UPI0020C01B7B|nr:fasciclin domain-containing protein [Methanoculleus sp. 7T]MCK8519306.1 fasciclin domain-containing protein [Methanoculleus sp. 7T]
MKNIFETAQADGRLSISVRLVEAGGVAETLRGDGPYTAFIPTNEAFSGIPEEMLEAIVKNRERLAGMIMYHVVRGKLTTLELTQMEAIRTLQEDHLNISSSPEGIRLNDAVIIQSDIECTNGMYHIIDSVLIPRAVEARVGRTV